MSILSSLNPYSYDYSSDVIIALGHVVRDDASGANAGIILKVADSSAGITADSFVISDDRFEIVQSGFEIVQSDGKWTLMLKAGESLGYRESASMTISVTDDAGNTDWIKAIVASRNIDGEVFHGNGDDGILYGSADDDIIYGGGYGNEVLYGGAGDDVLNGRDGSDVLYGGVGNNSLLGGRGDDIYVLNTDATGTDTLSNFSISISSWGNDKIRVHVDDATGIDTLDELYEAANLRVEKGHISVEGLSRDYTDWDEKFNAAIYKGDTLIMVLEDFTHDLTFGMFEVVEGKYSYGTPNQAPTFAQNSYTASIARGAEAGDIITNIAATDADDDTLTYSITAGNDAGLFIVDATNGDIKLAVPEMRTNATDHTLTLTATDAAGNSDTATVTITDYAIRGTDAQDALHGTTDGDTIYGYGGSDTITGGDGSDVLWGGSGVDIIYGGGATDVLSGGEGDDIIYGGDGDDVIYGNEGDDTIYGGAGRDLIKGQGGADSFVLNTDATSSADMDVIGGFSVASGDKIRVESFNGVMPKTIEAFLAAANLRAETGEFDNFGTNNTIIYKVVGGDNGESDDIALMALVYFSEDLTLDMFDLPNATANQAPTFAQDSYSATIAQGAEVGDIITNIAATDADSDTLIYAITAGNDAGLFIVDATNGDIKLATPETRTGAGDHTITITATDTAGLTDTATVTITDYAMRGTDGEDSMTGSDETDFIYGYGGDDILNGGAGGDWIDGYDGDDMLYGGDDADAIWGGGGADTLYGGAGDDWLFGEGGDDRLYGGDGGDVLYGNEGDDRLSGDAGGDWLYGQDGDDRLYGNDGDDWLYGQDGDDTLSGGAGDDTLRGDSGGDDLHGGAGDDVLYGSGGDDTLYGDAGDDTLHGGSASDVLYGDAGADTLNGSYGGDVIYGGVDNDILNGGAGDDLLEGSAGNDTLYGGAGSDYLRGDSLAVIGTEIFVGPADADIFVLNTADSGTDTITDFTPSAGDKIRIEEFTGVIPRGIETFLTAANLRVEKGHIKVDAWANINIPTDDNAITNTAIYSGDRLVMVLEDFTENLTLDMFDLPNATPNSAPVFAQDSYSASIAQGAEAGDIITNIAATDADSDTLTYSITAGNDAGLFIVDATNGDIKLAVPDKPTDATDHTITITATDTTDNADTATVTITDYAIRGTDVQDVFHGTIDGDTIYGYGGHDYLNGGDGDDTIYGGDGIDRLRGNDGDDTLYGGSGSNSLTGGDGDDTLYGGSDRDSLSGGYGNDVLYGGSGNDKLFDLRGIDLLHGGLGADLFKMSFFFDTPDDVTNIVVDFNAEEGDIIGLHGIRVSGTFQPSSVEELAAAAGLRFDTSGSKVIKGHESGENDADINDTVIYKGDTAIAVIEDFTGLTLDMIELGVSGSDDDNIIHGGDVGNRISGNAGDDTIYGGAGKDYLYGNAGDDTIYGGDGDDSIYGSAGDDIIHGEDGNDSLIGGVGADTIYGGAGIVDHIYGNDGDDILYGGAGDDFLNGQGGADIFALNADDAGADLVRDFTPSDGDKIRVDAFTGAIPESVEALLAATNLRVEKGHITLPNPRADSHSDSKTTENTAIYSGDKLVMVIEDFEDDLTLDMFDLPNAALNSAPTFAQDSYSVSIARGAEAGDIITNIAATDVDDDTLTYSITAGNDAGLFIVDATNGDIKLAVPDKRTGAGDRTLTIAATDTAGNTADATVTITDYAVRGTDGNDTFHGRDGADFIYGYGGNDHLYGIDGDDTLYGGAGNDYLEGMDGDDTLSGGAGDDDLDGMDGDDTLYGGDGDDYLFGENGDDTLSGGAGDDYLYGDFYKGAGDDILDGGSGDDDLWGGAGDDILDGGAGDDDLWGGAGDDILDGGAGDDDLWGGAGDDILNGGSGDDDLWGGAGDDILDGGAGNDDLWGGGGDDILDGGAGNDDVRGGNDDGTLYGGAGNDRLNGEGGDDTLYGGDGKDYLRGGDDADIFVLGSENDTVVDFTPSDGDKIRVTDFTGTIPGSVEAFLTAANLRVEKGHIKVEGFNSGRDSTATENTAIYRGDTLLMVLEDFTDDLTLDMFDLPNATANNAPTFAQDSYSATLAETAEVGSAVVAVQASDVDAGNTLTYSITDGDGLFAINNDGEITLTGALDYETATTHTLTVQVADSGGLTATTTITVNVTDVTEINTIRGTEGDDGYANDSDLIGTDEADAIYGYGGRDILRGRDGDDILYGGDAHDWLYGGRGDDTIYGGAGDDRLDGDGGADALYGEDGDDRLDGDEGDDTLYGGDGDDYLFGKNGDDTLSGGAGDDYLYGDFYNGAGDDILDGGSGDDYLDGGIGTNLLHGGAGADVFNLNERQSGRIYFRPPATDIVVDFSIADGDHLALRNMVIPVQGTFNPSSIKDLEIDGWLRFDTSGSTIIEGHESGENDADIHDTVIYLGDTIIAVLEDFTDLTPDMIHFAVTGSDDDDIIHGSGGDNKIKGKDGNDTIYGGAGDDYIYGDDYSRGIELSFPIGEGDDVIHGGAGDDTILGGDGDDTLHGDAGDDTLYGGDDDDTVHGGDGDDRLSGGADDDTIHGGAGDDTLYGNSGNDVLYGGAGDDTLYGNSGNDVLYGGAGDDFLLGQGGVDIFVLNADDAGVDIVGDFSAFRHIGMLYYNDKIRIASVESSTPITSLEELYDIANLRVEKGHITRPSYDTTRDDKSIENTAIYMDDALVMVLEDFDRDLTLSMFDLPNAVVNQAPEFSLESYTATLAEDAAIGSAVVATHTISIPITFYGVDFTLSLDGKTITPIVHNDAETETEAVEVTNPIAIIATDVDLDDLTYSIIDGDGLFAIDADSGEITLTGALDYETATTHTFTIQVEDSGGLTATATVTINVENVNEAPTFAQESYSADITNIVTIGYGVVIARATDAEGDAVRNYSITGGNDDGIFTITTGGYISQTLLDAVIDPTTYTLTVTATDRAGNAVDTTVTLIDGAIRGTDGNDEIEGTDGVDFIYGYGGDDTLDGGAGDDDLRGKDGDDTLYGGDGIDRLRGNDGDDMLSGGAGDDYLFGGRGDDTLYGGDGADHFYGDSGDDTLYGGDGNDGLTGNDGDDTIYGENGNDTLYGGRGDDMLYGGDGNDRLTGNDGDDTIYGENGNDTLYGGRGDDMLYGGDGNDRLNGDSGDDTLHGGDGRDYLDGGDGADIFVLGSGSDTVVGFTPSDGDKIRVDDYTGAMPRGIEAFLTAANLRVEKGHIKAGWGWGDSATTENTAIYRGDTLLMVLRDFDADLTLDMFDLPNATANSAPTFAQESYTATIARGAEIGSTVASATATDADGDALTYAITAGNDAGLFDIDEDSGEITLTVPDTETDAGDHTLTITATDTAGNAGTATVTITDYAIRGTDSHDRIDRRGTDGADTIYGYDGQDHLHGERGDDVLYGGGSADKLYGSAGDDILYGGDGSDKLDGSSGTDILYGGGDADVFNVNVDHSNSIESTDIVVDFNVAEGDRIRLDHLQVDGTFQISSFEDLESAFGVRFDTSDNKIIEGYESGENDADINDTVIYHNNTMLMVVEDSIDITFDMIDLHIVGGEGDDTIYGGEGADYIDSGAGADIIDGGAGYDEIRGGAGDDTLYGGDGLDRLIGGDGDDILDGGAGTDFLDGGAGADIFVLNTDDLLGRDILVGFDADAGDKIRVHVDNSGITTLEGLLTDAGLRIGYHTFHGISLSLRATIYKVVDDADDAYLMTLLSKTTSTLTFDMFDVVVNEPANQAPEFAQDSYTATLAENAEAGSAVVTVQATDANAGDTLTYSIVSDNIPGLFVEDTIIDNSPPFAIDANTGAITLTGALDFETATTHTFTIQVEDSAGLTDTATITINVTDSAIRGTDDDDRIGGTADADTIYGYGGDDFIYAQFGDDTLYGGTGDDVLHGSGDNDTLYGGAGDDTLDGGAGLDTLYGGAGDDEFALDIHGLLQGHITDDSHADTLKDFGNGNDKIHIHVPASVVPSLDVTISSLEQLYSIFNLRVEKGHIAVDGLVGNIDDTAIENTAIYSGDVLLMVLEDFTADLTLNMFDLSHGIINRAPEFAQETYTATLAETAETGSAVVTVAATDADIDDTLTYSIIGGDGGGDGLFAINDDGEITLTGALDYETATSHNLTIKAQDKNGDTDTAKVVVHVTDANDNAPIFDAATHKVEIPELTEIGTTLTTVTARDADTSALRYSILGGRNANLFSINEDTGAITLKGFLDFETAESHRLVVQASDGVSTDTINVIIGVVDEMDCACLDIAANTEEITAGTVLTASITHDDPNGYEGGKAPESGWVWFYQSKPDQEIGDGTSTYTVREEDSGEQICVRITYMDGNGRPEIVQARLEETVQRVVIKPDAEDADKDKTYTAEADKATKVEAGTGADHVRDGMRNDVIDGGKGDDEIDLSASKEDNDVVIYGIGNQMASDGSDSITSFVRGRDKFVFQLKQSDIDAGNIDLSADDGYEGFINYVTKGTEDLIDDQFWVNFNFSIGDNGVQMDGISFHFKDSTFFSGGRISMPIVSIEFADPLSVDEVREAYSGRDKSTPLVKQGLLSDFDYLDDFLGGDGAVGFEII